MEEESGNSGFGGFVKFWHTAEMRGEVVVVGFFQGCSAVSWGVLEDLSGVRECLKR